MGIKLYATDMSPPVRAALMTLELYNVPFEKIEVNLLANEHKTPEYLEKNPMHSIPVLEDDDLIIHDSHAILAYIADVYGSDDSWYPKDARKRALVNQKLFFDTAILFPRLWNVTYYIVLEGKNTIEQKLLDDIDQAYGFLEKFLSRTTYIAGDNITIADVAALANMTSLEYILPIDSEKYPNITAWLENLKNMPFCKNQNEFGAARLNEVVKQGLAK